MHDRFNTVGSDLLAFIFPAQLYARVGRVLLLLASIVLIAFPFTQSVWTWDRFLHGGHDFETNVLLIVITLCLVLVMVQSCRQGIRILIHAPVRLLLPRPRLASAEARCGGDRTLDLPTTIFSAPLQL